MRGDGGTQLSTAGVVNLGNTCYLSSVLQALASCQSLIKSLAETLELLAACNSAADPALASALHDCLVALQPQPRRCLVPSSLAPRTLLHELRSRVPAGMLEAGEEHDVAETLELLCALVTEELQAAFHSGLQRQMAARDSIAAILSSPGSLSGAAVPGLEVKGRSSSEANGHAAGSSSSSSSDGNEQQSSAVPNSSPMHRGCPSASHEASSSEGAQQQAILESSRPDTPPPLPESQAAESGRLHAADPVLQAWKQHTCLPLQGANAHELQCARCKHRSMVQLSPFWVLPLGIPLASSTTTLLGTLRAAPGAHLDGCLASFHGYEAVQGWRCPRCSLVASLQAATAAAGVQPRAAAALATNQHEPGDSSTESGNATQVQALQQDAAAAAAGLPPRIQSLQQMLDSGGQLVESEAFPGLLAKAGLAWLRTPSLAFKRTVAAQLPRVLCLQLRRAFWSAHGHCKVAGHVRFPLLLPLSSQLAPLLGHSGASEAAAASTPLQHVPLYQLRAVVVHLGLAAGQGHYKVYRCLGTGSSSSACDVGSWVCASDEAVEPVSMAEVMDAEASLLMYEHIN